MKNNMLPRVCRECRHDFIGGPRAWYCPICRAERIRQQNKDFKARKRAGAVIGIGDVIKCELCGAEVVKTGGPRKYCEACAKRHLKEIDKEQSLRWKRENPEKIREIKRKFSKTRHLEAGKQSGVKYITWEKESRKWIVRPYINGKQIYGGKFADLDEAKEKTAKLFIVEEV